MIPDDKNLIPLLGLEAMPEAEARAMLADLSEALMQAVMFRVMPQLLSGEQAELTRLAEAGDGDALYSFLKDRVPELDQVFAEEGARMRETLARTMPEATEIEQKYGIEEA